MRWHRRQIAAPQVPPPNPATRKGRGGGMRAGTVETAPPISTPTPHTHSVLVHLTMFPCWGPPPHTPHVFVRVAGVPSPSELDVFSSWSRLHFFCCCVCDTTPRGLVAPRDVGSPLLGLVVERVARAAASATVLDPPVPTTRCCCASARCRCCCASRACCPITILNF